MELPGYAQVEEYKYLRQEHENNRKFIFERPLFIVVGMLAAFLGFKGANNDLLGLLPFLFLLILWFNMWFTYNRMQSSARIVTYIQKYHEGADPAPWIGWENSLQVFRAFVREKKPKVDLIAREHRITDSMGFYLHIYYFHVFCGMSFLPLALFQCGTIPRIIHGSTRRLDVCVLSSSVFLFCLFIIMLLPYRPSRVRSAIPITRAIWEAIIAGEQQKSADQAL